MAREGPQSHLTTPAGHTWRGWHGEDDPGKASDAGRSAGYVEGKSASKQDGVMAFENLQEVEDEGARDRRRTRPVRRSSDQPACPVGCQMAWPGRRRVTGRSYCAKAERSRR